jgi:hypothetical protein
MDSILFEIMSLGHPFCVAHTMMASYKKKGGLYCCLTWPNSFSWWAGERNVLDILLENKHV